MLVKTVFSSKIAPQSASKTIKFDPKSRSKTYMEREPQKYLKICILRSFFHLEKSIKSLKTIEFFNVFCIFSFLSNPNISLQNSMKKPSKIDPKSVQNRFKTISKTTKIDPKSRSKTYMER